MESQLVPIQTGFFQTFDYTGTKYYRLSTELGHEWITSERVVELSLANALERHWNELSKPKSYKFDLSNNEMFPLMMEAIKSRKPFDSSDHQPNGSNDRKFVVSITESKDAILSIHPNITIHTFQGVKHYSNPFKLAIFGEDKIEVYIPSLEELPKTKGRVNLIKTILSLISDHFDIPNFIYKENKDALGSFTIYKKERVYVEAKGEYFTRRGEVITTSSPLIFDRIQGMWYNSGVTTGEP